MDKERRITEKNGVHRENLEDEHAREEEERVDLQSAP